MNETPGSEEFNIRRDLIYLNHAGISPWPLRTARAVQQFAEENALNGSLHYPSWLEIEKKLRNQSKDLLNAQSADCIAFLKNTSEALSFVAYGINWEEGDNIISNNQEFPSNRIVWESLSAKGVELREADLNSDESPEDAIFSKVDKRTRMISVSSVQFSTGLRMDLDRIGGFCKKRNILFCIDAIQSLGAMRFDVQKVQADFVAADGHKWLLGPEGLAIFYCNPDVKDRLRLNEYGWHMVEDLYNYDRKDWNIAKSSRRFECGSPNMIGIHALNSSLSLLLEIGIKKVEDEILKRIEYLFDEINANPELELITPSVPDRYAGIVTFRHSVRDNFSLYKYLIDKKVVCSLRSGGIRLSPHFYTSYDHLDQTMELVKTFRS